MAGGTTGWNGTDAYWLDDVWRVDSRGTWTQLPTNTSQPRWQARQNPGFAATKHVAILAGGEAFHPPDQSRDTWQDVWEMNLATGEFHELPVAPWEPRTGHGMVTVDAEAGRILLMGGGSCRSCVLIHKWADVWSYATQTRTWTRLPDAPWKPRWFHGLAATGQGEVIMAGGQTGFFSQRDVWRMDRHGAWTELTPQAPWGARSQFGFMASRSSAVLVLVGGMGSSGDAWQMNTTTGHWLQLGALDGSNFGPALTVWGGRAVVSGGSVPCRGWHCGSQQFVQTSKQWGLALNITV